ncbi:MAG: nuclear transport factor 2 family protein [Sphingomonadales bacterium]
MTISDAVIAETVAKQAITDALMRSSHGIDRQNVDVLKSAYWEDATVDYGMFKGAAMEFCDFLMPGLAAFKITQHSLSNILIEMRGDSEAKVETYVRAYHHSIGEDNGAIDMVVGGRYLDRMEKRGDSWRIAHRTYVMDWNTNGPGTAIWDEGLYAQLDTRGGQHPNDPFDGFMA